LLLVFVFFSTVFAAVMIWQRGAKRDRLNESRAKDKALNQPESH
jgi:hypothetical protein